MPPIRGWFKARKPLQASRKKYYEDIFGEKNPEEDLEGVHILDSESESDPEFSSRKARRQAREKPRFTLRQSNKDQSDREQAMETADSDEIVAPRVDRTTGTRTLETKSNRRMLVDKRLAVAVDDDSDVDDLFVADLREHGMITPNDRPDITETV